MKKFWPILIAIAFIAMASMPVMAASTEERITAIEKQLAATWKFYGSVRMTTFYNDFKAKDNHKDNSGSGINDKGSTWTMQVNSRIGAQVTIGDISGNFEYGHLSDGPYTRLLCGTWNFGPGQIVIGRDYTPLTWDINNKVYATDSLMHGFGQFYGDRENQIKLIYGAFQFALIDPTRGTTMPKTDPPSTYTGTDVYLPRIEVSYDLNFGPVTGRVIAGYKTFDIVANEDLANEDEKSVDSYILALALKYAAGPFYAGLTGFYAQNVGAFASAGSMVIRANDNPDANGTTTFTDRSGYPDGDEDCKTWGFAVALGYKVSDMISFEAGYGYQQDKWDLAGSDSKLKATSYYLNMPITVAKNFWIIPEIGVENFKSSDLKIGKTTYIGAKWQINF